MTKRENTIGAYKVGVSFTTGNPVVHGIKERAASLITVIDSIEETDPASHGEVARLRALAMTAIENGAMWAVKAATKRARES